ncbi:hypothetical protein BASA81_009819 [Batrachochytrium salamandrivorans]|nr:hypothetical protein BASA81_009819 [Batrachochytrium salamandrivorans]
MKEFDELQALLLREDATFFSPDPACSLAASSLAASPSAPFSKTRWVQGYICLGCLVVVVLLGVPTGHAPGLFILALPVLVFLNEGFQNPDPNNEDATRRCAMEAFGKGLLLGPPLLACAECVLGVLLALVCFGADEFQRIVWEASKQHPSGSAPGTLSTRLYREAAQTDPWAAGVFALLTSLLIAGGCEEGFKMCIGAWQMLVHKQHKRTLQPNLVLAAAGLGLAYSESVLAIISCSATSSQRSIALVAAERVLTCFPIHIFCAVWTARRASSTHSAKSWFAALLPSAIAHGLYDFGLLICSNYASTRFIGLGWGMCSAFATTVAGIRA